MFGYVILFYVTSSSIRLCDFQTSNNLCVLTHVWTASGQPRPDFEENVREGGKIFRGGANNEIQIPHFNTFYVIMSARLVKRNIIKKKTLMFAKAGIYKGRCKNFWERC